MRRRLPIFYSALLLTGANLLLRLVGTSFQVYLSGRIGASGVGLLQLVLSVGNLALVAAVGGIRTAAMYLTAEELGKGRKKNVVWVLSGCFLYSILCSGLVAGGLYGLAPRIAQYWIGNPATVNPLRLFAVFLPVVCLTSVMTGYFTAAQRIGTLAAVEAAEQMVCIGLTVLALKGLGVSDPAMACLCVILGSSGASVFALLALVWLRFREKPHKGEKIPIALRLVDTAAPLAMADVVKSGINTTENLMVPRRLVRNTATADPLAAFGVVSGMVFPVLMFPACILFALTELLIPELARCAAAESRRRIQYLTGKSLRVALLYGLIFGGLEYLLAEPLCAKLYGNPEAGRQLRLYALLIPMLYCDAITDAMTKGLGQQKICVRYNILTSFLDVVFLFVLLPEYGMGGYFVSFLVTHVINFVLSLRRLLKITRQPFPFSEAALALLAAVTAAMGAGFFQSPAARILGYLGLLGSLWCLLGVTGKADLLWVKGLVKKK